MLKLSVHSPDSESFFVLGIGPFLVMWPLFLRVLWEFQWKMDLKSNIIKKALSDGIFANPRPLYNSNMAKVSI